MGAAADFLTGDVITRLWTEDGGDVVVAAKKKPTKKKKPKKSSKPMCGSKPKCVGGG